MARKKQPETRGTQQKHRKPIVKFDPVLCKPVSVSDERAGLRRGKFVVHCRHSRNLAMCTVRIRVWVRSYPGIIASSLVTSSSRRVCLLLPPARQREPGARLRIIRNVSVDIAVLYRYHPSSFRAGRAGGSRPEQMRGVRSQQLTELRDASQQHTHRRLTCERSIIGVPTRDFSRLLHSPSFTSKRLNFPPGQETMTDRTPEDAGVVGGRRTRRLLPHALHQANDSPMWRQEQTPSPVGLSPLGREQGKRAGLSPSTPVEITGRSVKASSISFCWGLSRSLFWSNGSVLGRTVAFRFRSLAFSFRSAC